MTDQPSYEKTKTCPYCAETIKAAATKCRYCGSDLTAKPAAPAANIPIAPPVVVQEEKKGNAIFVWPAIIISIGGCLLFSMMEKPFLAAGAVLIGIVIIVVAMATGRLKLFG